MRVCRQILDALGATFAELVYDSDSSTTSFHALKHFGTLLERFRSNMLYVCRTRDAVYSFFVPLFSRISTLCQDTDVNTIHSVDDLCVGNLLGPETSVGELSSFVGTKGVCLFVTTAAEVLFLVSKDFLCSEADGNTLLKIYARRNGDLCLVLLTCFAEPYLQELILFPQRVDFSQRVNFEWSKQDCLFLDVLRLSVFHLC